MYADESDDFGGEMFQAEPTMSGLAYVPDLLPVGSGAAGTYYPRDTQQDAAALHYLNFYPSPYYEDHRPSQGSQGADVESASGAWDETFQNAVRLFQTAVGITVDGWIGPQTRQKLAEQVVLANAREVPIIPPLPGPVPGPTPSGKPKDKTMLYVGLGVGGAALAGLLYWAFK